MADTVVDHAADRANEDGGPCAHKEHRHGLCTGHEPVQPLRRAASSFAPKLVLMGVRVSTSFRVI